jgi:hypothetical protein
MAAAFTALIGPTEKDLVDEGARLGRLETTAIARFEEWRAKVLAEKGEDIGPWSDLPPVIRKVWRDATESKIKADDRAAAEAAARGK